MVEFYLGAKPSINSYISPKFYLEQEKELVSYELCSSIVLMVQLVVPFKGKHSLLLVEVFLTVLSQIRSKKRFRLARGLGRSRDFHTWAPDLLPPFKDPLTILTLRNSQRELGC